MAGSSATYVEDFLADVDYLGTLDYIDRENIAAIGICGSGGFALSAASMDSRIRLKRDECKDEVPETYS